MERKLAAMREDAVKNLPRLIIKAENVLKLKGCRVYLAADRAEARSVLAGLCDGQKQVVRSYSETLREIGFDALMAAMDIRVTKTSVTEIIMEQLEPQLAGYPFVPSQHFARAGVVKAIQDYLGIKGVAELAELKRLLQKKIRTAVMASEFGITGSNGLAAESGTLVLAEDEGNARAVSNFPYRHIAVAGIDKLTATAEEAMTLIQGAALYGLRRNIPACISFISGPSRTGDIEFRMAYGMHGPKEVYVILLDNGRLALREQGYGEMLKCIGCGACLKTCRQLTQENDWPDLAPTMKGISLALIQGRIKRPVTFCVADDFFCPAGITMSRFAEALIEIEPRYAGSEGKNG